MIKINKILPMFTSLVTTMNKYENDVITSSGIIDTSKRQGSLKEYQTVLAVGTSIRDIKVGDIVWINPTRFGVKKHKAGTLNDGIVQDNPIINYNFPILDINNKECLFLQDKDIDFIIEDFEEIPQVQSTLILPEEDKKIIL